MLNRAVQSLKIDEKTQQVYGSIDETEDDPVAYDYVIMTAEVGAVQRIINATATNYQAIPSVAATIQQVQNKFIDKMKIAPDYKVFKLLKNLRSNQRIKLKKTQFKSRSSEFGSTSN
jgi:coproporphyrinogen III oxidase-like Fe-S oxidoreductase